ncbi:hypothetical protein, partial [Chitinophaga sp.]|uniref:hypothetical protein n=1 Tax=Chitinophaga sp. TaxID=1869181 RepID=UPI002F92892E
LKPPRVIASLQVYESSDPRASLANLMQNNYFSTNPPSFQLDPFSWVRKQTSGHRHFLEKEKRDTIYQ